MKTLIYFSALFLLPILAISQSNVRLVSVNPETHEVTLKNFGNVAQNIGTHFLCNFPDYVQFNSMVVLSGSVNLMPNASVTVIYPPCNGLDGEQAYYINNVFTSATSMKDYMEWGSGGHTREGLAVTNGFWTAGQFVPNDPGFTYTGGGADHGASFWTNQTPGCIYALACNYNSLATVDDGSCEFTSCAGCMVECASNFNPDATIEDGSCIGVGCVSSCPTDLDGNGVVNTGDLLGFMATFGNVCP